MQPYLFPYIGYIQLMNMSDKFVIYDDVNFINKGWINRNRILVNGQAFMFTIPLQNASQNKLINEVILEENPKWREKTLKTIEQAYKKAPTFEVFMPVVKTVFTKNSRTIADLALESLLAIKDYLALSVEIVPSSAIYQNTDLKAQNRILDICKQTGATRYINPTGGMELYSKEDFVKENIELYFIKSNPIHYQQNTSTFVPWLSILDVLMYNDIPTVKAFLNEYELL
jgi:WbqC-like protein family